MKIFNLEYNSSSLKKILNLISNYIILALIKEKIYKIKGMFIKSFYKLKRKQFFAKIIFKNIVFVKDSIRDKYMKASLKGIAASGSQIWRIIFAGKRPHNGCRTKKVRRL